MNSIFTGIKVLDITKVFSGPFATRMLADYGAEVLKIEHEKNYDDTRHYPPLKNNWSGYYEILNRNKKGIALFLKDPADQEKLYQLVKEADVFVENLTPSTKFKLKVDYETLKAINPRLIYASLSGVGQDSNRKYYDVIAQAQSGFMSLTGHPEEPMKIGPAIIDAFAGMTLAYGIASALFYRERTQKGQYLDVSMLATGMNLLESNLIGYSLDKVDPVRPGNQDNAIAPFGVYKTQDTYIVVAAGNDAIFTALSTFLKEHTSFDESLFVNNHMRLEHKEELTKIIELVFGKFHALELEEMLSERGVPCSRVYEMSDVYGEEDNYRRKALVKIDHPLLGACVIPGVSINFSEADEVQFHAAPKIGEHDKEYGL